MLDNTPAPPRKVQALAHATSDKVQALAHAASEEVALPWLPRRTVSIGSFSPSPSSLGASTPVVSDCSESSVHGGSVHGGDDAGLQILDADGEGSVHGTSSVQNACRCGKALPSRMTVCQRCWFKKMECVAALGHLKRGHLEVVRAALMLSQSSREEITDAGDPHGTGLSISEEGFITSITPGGMAYRWEE